MSPCTAGPSCRTRPTARLRARDRDPHHRARSGRSCHPFPSDSRLCMRPHTSPIRRPVSVDPVNDTTGTAGCAHDRRAGLAIAVHELDDVRRQARLEQNLDEHGRRVRHVLRRLEHARVSADQRREHLPRRDRQRKIERRDDPAHADRAPIAHRPLGAQLARHRVAEQLASHRRRVVRGIDSFLDVASRLGERLPHLAGHEVRDLFLSPCRGCRRAAEHIAARRRRRAPPALESALRRLAPRDRHRRRPIVGNVPITSRVSAGLTLSNVSWLAASTHWPAMKF